MFIERQDGWESCEHLHLYLFIFNFCMDLYVWMCVWEWESTCMYTHMYMCSSKDNLPRVSSHPGTSDSGHRVWWPAPLPTEPYIWFLLFTFIVGQVQPIFCVRPHLLSLPPLFLFSPSPSFSLGSMSCVSNSLVWREDACQNASQRVELSCSWMALAWTSWFCLQSNKWNFHQRSSCCTCPSTLMHLILEIR